MTADEIRKQFNRETTLAQMTDIPHYRGLQMEVLIEIAAQLAEANALARFELGLEDGEGPQPPEDIGVDILKHVGDGELQTKFPGSLIGANLTRKKDEK